MEVNQENILQVIHATRCNLSLAIEALVNNNSWSDIYVYVKERM